ncbi:hypothetical protein C8R47DRAFT_260487 [Mycena vitilis]|nr:hypothetical protein C8R47DRAFT_260487 [Mycena vitilis]
MVATRKKTYASVAPRVRTSTKNLLEEAAEVGASFQTGTEAEVFSAEGELREGSATAVDQGALRVYAPPRIRASDLEEYLQRVESQNDEEDEVKSEQRAESEDSEEGWSDDSPIGSSSGSPQVSGLSSQAVDWEVPEGTFIVPRVTAKKVYEWSRPLDTKYKFFPTWFDLSMDEDQLGPLPKYLGEETKENYLPEDDDLHEAIRRSIEDQLMDDAARISSMAVIVEEPEDPRSNAGVGKGKGISAEERSTAFGEYLRKIEQMKAAGSSKKDEPVKKAKKARAEKAKSHKDKDSGPSGQEERANGAKKSFMRPSSQVPGGGWFRATTEGSGRPPSPSDSSSSDSSAGSSGSSSTTSSSEEES